MKTWFEYLNTGIAVAVIGPAVLGVAATAFKLVTDERARIDQLDQRFALLATEYEGRLSQYSEWLVYLTQTPDGGKPAFRACVDADLLRRSIREFAAVPTIEPVTRYLSNKDCREGFRFNSVFTALSKDSTLSVLSEMRVIQDELDAVRTPARSVLHVMGCQDVDTTRSERLIKAVNAMLHPDAFVAHGVSLASGRDGALSGVEALRAPFMCSFYGISPQRLWYTDIPWG